MQKFRGLPVVMLAAAAGVTLPARARAQADWHSLPSLHAREGHCMGYDPDRDRIVMFGGSSPGIWMETDETWEWTGSEWLPRQVPGPSPRHGAAMAWCPQRRELLLFGGMHQDVHGSWPETYYDDTWSWNGQRWEQLRPTRAPSPRLYAAMATDPVRGEIVLFGGYLAGAGPLAGRSDETWVWDGSDWTQRTPNTVPIGRHLATIVQSPNSASLLMVGGIASGAWAVDGRELWEWDGADWTRLPAPIGPYPLEIPCAAYDPVTRAIFVVEDIHSYRGSRDTKMWSWDGATWTETLPTSSHFRDWPPYLGHGRVLIHDPTRQRVLAFGGGTFQLAHNGFPPLRATWSLDPVRRRWSVAHEYPWIGYGQHGVAHDADRGRTLFVGDGKTWAYQAGRFHNLPITSPPHRGFAGMIECHYASGLVVLHGSHADHLGRHDDRTWLFDGTQWTSRLYTPRPIGNAVTRLRSTYDPIRRRILAVDAALDELWSFEPAAGWQVVASVPPGVGGLAAFDVARRRFVLVNSSNDGVWEWDGSNWMQMNHATALPTGPAYGCYVPELGGVVLQRTRHASNPQYNDGGTWLWDGIDWRQISWTKLPSKVGAGDIQHVFYDPERGRLVASYDGLHVPFFEFFDARLSADALYPRPGQTSRFTFRDVDQPGRMWFLGLALSSDTGIALNPHPYGVMRRFPLDPDFVLAATLGNLRGTLDVRGEGAIALPIPNDQSLLGLQLHAAALTYGPSSFGTISNVLELEVVR